MIHKGTQTIPKRYLDYGSLTIVQASLKVKEATTVLKSLVKQGELIIPELTNIHFEGTFTHFFENDYLHSHNEQYSIEWPTNVFICEADQGFKETMRGGTLVAKSLPLYPDYFHAIKNELGVDLLRYQGWQNTVVFLLPNYMARIVHVKIGKSRLSVNVQTLEANLNDLMGKLYIEYPTESESTEFSFTRNTIEVPLKERPSQVWLYLLDREKGDILDYRRIRLNWGRASLQEGVTLDITWMTCKGSYNKGRMRRWNSNYRQKEKTQAVANSSKL